jgi:hypothetical protein
MKVHWTRAGVAHISTRSQRYSGAADLALEWVDEAVADPLAVVTDPDPHSRTGGMRIVGYSPSAGFVVTVIAGLVDGRVFGSTAWKATGGDRRAYREAVARSRGEDQ